MQLCNKLFFIVNINSQIINDGYLKCYWIKIHLKNIFTKHLGLGKSVRQSKVWCAQQCGMRGELTLFGKRKSTDAASTCCSIYIKLHLNLKQLIGGKICAMWFVFRVTLDSVFVFTSAQHVRHASLFVWSLHCELSVVEQVYTHQLLICEFFSDLIVDN